MEISLINLFVAAAKLICMVYLSLLWWFMLYFTDEPNHKHSGFKVIVLLIPILTLFDFFFVGFIKWKM